MSVPTRVGLVGANTTRGGWAIQAHVPAIAGTPGLELAAVATSRIESARTAAAELGAPAFHTNAADLAADPTVDLVVVGVNVRAHAEVVRAALAAGKPVLCEWPLTLTAEGAAELTAEAAAAGVPGLVGLQARMAPAVRHARQLLDNGYLGDLLSVSLRGSSPMPGAAIIPEAFAWHLEVENGITVLNIPTMHALDALCTLSGEVDVVAAEVLVSQPEVTLATTGQRVRRTADDTVALLARTPDGVSVDVRMQGGSQVAVHSSIEMRGTDGILVVETVTPSQFQSAPLRLRGTREATGSPTEVDLPPSLVEQVPPSLRGGHVENLAHLYAALRDSWGGDPAASGLADFAHATGRHRLVESVRTLATT